MCGIVGYVGPKPAAPILIDGLRKLEYRGYDSAGLAVHDGAGVEIIRAVGKLDNLVRAIEDRKLAGTTGIGHTRWATHGRPSEANAHPHAAGAIALVHNGIIENHLLLKRELEQQGVKFSSDTDTEIVAHLVNRALEQGAPGLFAAVRVALRQVRGAYALAVLSKDEPDRLVVARHDSPLVIGVGNGETLCGSDIPALLAHTRDMIFLEDGELAELTAGGVRIETVDERAVVRAPRRIDWNPVQAEKGGFKHFMLKEIFEQPRAVEDTIRGRVVLEAGDVVDAEMGIDADTARRIGRVYLIACGTSFHAALVGKYWIEQLARVPVHAELASEVRHRDAVFLKDDLVIAVSQSGETLDTLVAARAAREAGATVLSIANVLESAIPRAAHGALYTHAGPEIGVASTKCFTTQLVALLLFSVYLGRRRGALSEARAREVLQALVELPSVMRRALEGKEAVAEVARRWHQAEHVLFLGRGLSYPIALEGALKLKEISYAHAEGYAAGEMKHGPIALIDERMPVIIVMPRDRHYDKTFANMQEVRARDGQVIAVATEGDTDVRSLAQFVLEIPKAADVVQPLLTVLPLQLLAYYCADFKGTDVDQPRNLAKTVTVE
jgi:glucosamine--fructose-6-phosphate aminotransferase (isomerizing)